VCKMDYTAIWIENVYCVVEKQWYSEDGDVWLDANGNTIVCPSFLSARILLQCGPRSGTVVG
jgi:hypothetical protein